MLILVVVIITLITDPALYYGRANGPHGPCQEVYYYYINTLVYTTLKVYIACACVCVFITGKSQICECKKKN